MCPTCLLWHSSNLVIDQHIIVMVMRWCSTNHRPIKSLSKSLGLHHLLILTTPSTPSASATLPIVPSALQPVSTNGHQIDWASKTAEVMRDQFGLKPKQQNLMYRTPYPAAYDQLSFPHKYKLPDFTKFSGQGEVSTVEHINRFLM